MKVTSRAPFEVVSLPEWKKWLLDNTDSRSLDLFLLPNRNTQLEMLTVYNDNKVVAACSYSLVSTKVDGECHSGFVKLRVEAIIVDKKERRKGISRCLIGILEDVVEERALELKSEGLSVTCEGEAESINCSSKLFCDELAQRILNIRI